ncbi:MAG: hypothetical protein BWY31_04194 [Lentisphaerae bacterium ADurb.Bin242]|nr:MAG: hypothetical protein BWY31_04194 [Lentisphaerae bacterium ADurb.Bin242]
MKRTTKQKVISLCKIGVSKEFLSKSEFEEIERFFILAERRKMEKDVWNPCKTCPDEAYNYGACRECPHWKVGMEPMPPKDRR